jgi:hypothetical protein
MGRNDFIEPPGTAGTFYRCRSGYGLAKALTARFAKEVRKGREEDRQRRRYGFFAPFAHPLRDFAVNCSSGHAMVNSAAALLH